MGRNSKNIFTDIDSSIVYIEGVIINPKFNQNYQWNKWENIFTSLAISPLDGLNGQIAALSSVDSSLLSYKHLFLQPLYIKDKRTFCGRIYKIVSKNLYAKAKTIKHNTELKTTLSVIMIGDRIAWVANIGNNKILYINNFEGHLAADAFSDPEKYLIDTGSEKYKHQFIFEALPFNIGNALIIISENIWESVGIELLIDIIRLKIGQYDNTATLLQSIIAEISKDLLDKKGALIIIQKKTKPPPYIVF